ncbi:hypothetical protein ACHAWO_006188 [Cyclotella atomus]|uniref:Uncharacterized protein n=1 Tax=Cyclotella atomus TaxID=382360 RepID=A0ABD3N016_9STRA
MQSEDPTVNHKFCGVDKCDADHKCLTPCPNGTECPSGESCFDNTPCSSTVAPPSFDFAYCGTSVADAVATCWQPCRSDSDCCFGQTCYSSATACPAPNFQGSAHFFCGTDFCDASFRCNKPCPSGFNWECDIGESCYANTPCDADLSANSTMRYGLPDSKLNLVMQYVPSLPNQSSESSAHTLPNAKLIVLTILLIAGNL